MPKQCIFGLLYQGRIGIMHGNFLRHLLSKNREPAFRTIVIGQTDRNTPGNYLLLYDGVCALCNGLVHFIIRRDSRGNFQFAPLQGETAQQYAVPDREQMNTVVLVVRHSAKQTMFTESDAVLIAVAALGGVWKMYDLLRFSPALCGIGSIVLLLREDTVGSASMSPARFRRRKFGVDSCCNPSDL